MRPRSFAEFVGQTELVGGGTFLRQAIVEDRVPSMVLWGPPGSGKTTLATIIAAATAAEFIQISATESGRSDLRVHVARAEEGRRLGQRTVLFIDEIHRWNKAQQDALLPHVERGTVTLIGATTENPSFEINAALLSRTRVFVLARLPEAAIVQLLRAALADRVRGLGTQQLAVADEVLVHIARMANGDARMALNTLEAASSGGGAVTVARINDVLQRSHLLYDKNGEEHHNVISALHKSIRGGDADASVYWLARMLEGGEDPVYVARRLVRAAAEDIGLANPSALILANAVFDACHRIGMPECSVHLAELVIYLAKSKKDASAYFAYQRAVADVRARGNLPVPLHIRNAPTKLMEDLGYGKGYRYGHTQDDRDQTYLPPELQGTHYM